MKHKYFLYAALFLSSVATQAQIFVSQTASGDNNGTSWANAYTNLQDALIDAPENAAIWVKAGTYYPTIEIVTGYPRSKAFFIANNVKLYGGFNGTETQLSQRNFSANPTILSGDFNNDDLDTNGDGISDINYQENAYTVFLNYMVDANSLIDGFTITGGVANNNANYTVDGNQINTSNGGGMNNFQSALTLRNLKFIDNYASFGGAMYNTGGTPKIYDSEFLQNQASYGAAVYSNWSCVFTAQNCDFFFNSFNGGTVGAVNQSVSKINDSYFAYNNGAYGGAIYNNIGTCILQNVKISNNIVTAQGGGIYNTSSSVANLYNVLINNNQADNGGGIYDYQSYSKLTNVTIVNNEALQKGGGMYCTLSQDNLNTRIYNSIIWGNTAEYQSQRSIYYTYFAEEDVHIRNSIIEYSGGSSNWNSAYGDNMGSNLDTDPMFVNPDNEDFTLQSTSPGLNSSYNQFLMLPNGSNAWTANDKDADGYSRLQGGGVDRGALEAGGLLGSGNHATKLDLSFNNPVAQGADLILSTSLSLENNADIYDSAGKLVRRAKLQAGNSISTNGLSSGIYYVKLIAEGQSATIKVVVN
ncbi:MAG: T9SS type A sorting domain-containing protein [Flavobacterium sp.]|nr:T9SS type A sorting domain-containing protein [Flavobacterium sp.]